MGSGLLRSDKMGKELGSRGGLAGMTSGLARARFSKRAERRLGWHDLFSLPVPLVSFAPSGKEAFWGAQVSDGSPEHPRTHSELDQGNGSEAHPIVLSCSGHLSQRWAA